MKSYAFVFFCLSGACAMSSFIVVLTYERGNAVLIFDIQKGIERKSEGKVVSDQTVTFYFNCNYIYER